LLTSIFRKRNNAKPYFNMYGKDTPDVSDYITNRLEPQINWYNNKATDNMYRYNMFQVLTLGISALIPIVNVINFEDNISVRVTSAILGGLIAAITGIMQLTKAQESWILYRSTAETLIKEYNLYMLKSGDYSDSDLTGEAKRKKLFIERCESIMSTEGTKYFSLRQQQKSPPTDSKSS
jgi:hypothetical protein